MPGAIPTAGTRAGVRCWSAPPLPGRLYHSVDDEPAPDWDLRDTAQQASWAEALIFELGRLRNPPRLRPGGGFFGG
jgi:hypothetical protein